MKRTETKPTSPTAGDSIFVYDVDGEVLEANVYAVNEDGTLQVDILRYENVKQREDGQWQIQEDEG